MGVTAPECVICAWRATCNLKFMYEGSSSLHCPEFTKDVSIGKKEESSALSINETSSIPKPESVKK